mgnify:CR=1 FL=1
MRFSSYSQFLTVFQCEKSWTKSKRQALWNLFRRFIMFNVFRMRFVKDSDNCLSVRILGMTFAYYKGEPVLMTDGIFQEIEGKREFGESIRPQET